MGWFAPRRTARRRRFTLAAGATAVFATALFSQPRPVDFVATFRGLTPEPADADPGTVRYHYAGKAAWLARIENPVPEPAADAPATGAANWVVPERFVTTGGLDRAFRTFAAEVPVGLRPAALYRYEVSTELDLPYIYGLPADARDEAERRAKYVYELYGRHYDPTRTDGEAARAFQVALWEVVHEAAGAKFDLTDGTFRADYPNMQAAPGFVRKAQDFVKSLTGDAKPFRLNPAFDLEELVYLKGVASPLAGGVVPQSQFALRPVVEPGAVGGDGTLTLAPAGPTTSGPGSGGSASDTGNPGNNGNETGNPGNGANGTPPLGNGGGTGAGGGTGTGTGAGTGTGGGTGAGGGSQSASNQAPNNFVNPGTNGSPASPGGGGNSSTVSQTPNNFLPPGSGVGSVPPLGSSVNFGINAPPFPSPPNGPGVDPGTNSTPVPGPPAAILALVAVGVLAARRAASRANRRA